MGDSYAIAISESDSIPIISVTGYLGEEAGNEVCEKVDPLLLQGRRILVFDFTQTKIINSPGVAALMDLSVKIRDDFDGRMFLTGVDSVKKKILSMVGVVTEENVAPSLTEALVLARKSSQTV